MVVHPASHRVPRALWYSGFLPILHSFVYEGLTLFAVPSQILPLKFQTCCRSATPKNRSPLVWALPVSLAATQGISLDFFSSDYLDVSVHRVGLPTSKVGWQVITPAGLPHSEIHGSMLTCSSPWLIAAYRVLLRFETPRHPPYALIRLTYVLRLKGIFALS